MPPSSLFHRKVLLKFFSVLVSIIGSFFIILVLCEIDVSYKINHEVIPNLEEINFDNHFFFESKIFMSTYYIFLVISAIALSSGYPFKKSIFTSPFMHLSIYLLLIPFAFLYIDWLVYSNFYLEKFIVYYYRWGNYDKIFKLKILSVIMIGSIVTIAFTKIVDHQNIIEKLKYF